MSERRSVILVVPNDLVVDTRGQKMAASLAHIGLRVTVVARASARAPISETVDGYQVIRIEVPPVPMVQVAPRNAGALQREAASLRKQARYAARRSVTAGTSLKRRVRLALRVARLESRRLRVSVKSRSLAAAEHRAHVGHDPSSDRVPWENWRETLLLPLALADAFWPVIEGLDPDIIQCHDLDGLAAAAIAHQRLNQAGKHVRLVYDAHENWAGLPDIDWVPRVHGSLLGLEKEFIRQADLVITVSDEIATTLRQRYDLKSVPLVLLNTPSVTGGAKSGKNLRTEAGVSDSDAVMVYSGSISHARRIPDLIQALPFVPQLHLVVVAVPFPHKLQPEFEELAETLGVADRLHIVAPVASNQVVDYLSGATFGVHPLLSGAPNHEMALPNKLFEYLHAGIPVVVSDCRTMSEFVRAKGIGLDFHFGDLNSLVVAITEVLQRVEHGDFQPSAELIARYTWDYQEPALALAYEEHCGSGVG
ncbi:MAG: glycosyltransferase family 4 protein [Actinomycetes bacterium]